MELNKIKMLPTCAELNNLDIVDFLASIGHLPKKIKGHNYWFLSPLRSENTPSFKVNRNLNRWKDFGIGEGSTLVDFGIKYYNCKIKELLIKLSSPFLPARIVPPKHTMLEELEEPKVNILDVHSIQSPQLIHYLLERRVALNVAQIFCREAKYRVGESIYYAICFKNRAGGYELRNKYFKGSSSPKDITFFEQCNLNTLAVFEGFFDFLSYLTIFNGTKTGHPDFLILNSLSFFEGRMRLMESHKRILLYLDNDLQGKQCARKAMDKSKAYKDRSGLYQGHKDLNDWICRIKG